MAVQFQQQDPAGKYKIAPKSIGQGGMGTIYLATNKQVLLSSGGGYLT